MEKAIQRLKELGDDHEKLVIDLKNGNVKFNEIDENRLDHLIRTYNYWVQCCRIAAWLLENDLNS